VRRPGQLAALIWPLSTIGCAPEPLTLSLPFADGAASALVVVEADGKTEVHAVDVKVRNDRGLLGERSGIDDDSPLSIAIASYAESLETIGLAPGRVISGEVGTSLPAAFDVKKAVIGRGDAVFHDDDLPPELSRFLVPPSCRPLVFDERWELEDPAYKPVGLVRDQNGGIALVVNQDAVDTLVLTPIPGQPLRAIDRISANDLNVYEARIAPNGESWLAGGTFDRGGLVAKYAVPSQLMFALEGTQPTFSSEWPAVFGFAPEFEGDDPLFYVPVGGGLVRLRSGRPEPLWPPEAFGGSRPPLFVDSEDNIYWASPNGVTIHHWLNGLDTPETTDIDQLLLEGRDSVLAIGVTKNGAAFAGTDLGVILKRSEMGHWQMFAREVLVGASIWSMARFGDDGLLVGSTYGKIVQIYDGLGQRCELSVDTGNFDVTLYLEVRPDKGEVWAAGFRSDAVAGVRYPYIARIRIP
jgi:hypothetical protein